MAWATTPEAVLVVVNGNSAISREIGRYYSSKRKIPTRNLCRIQAPERETIDRDEYNRLIAAPVSKCLQTQGLVEKVLYIVITQGVPLRVSGTLSMTGDIASVDSELTLLYAEIHGAPKHQTAGPIRNPYFRRKDARFGHPQFPIYLVTRLAAFDLQGVKAIIDRSLVARNEGKFVIDLRGRKENEGEEWLRTAAILLPEQRVVVDDTTAVLYKQKRVIGYASWGSNDPNRHHRRVGFDWLPGAIASEFVSTNGRTFERPPENWKLGQWGVRWSYFFASPQSLTTDLLADGATGASGHTDEPYLEFTPRPDYLFPAYFSGKNLAESYYLSIPALSWQNIVVGDPLCAIGPPR